MRNLRLDCTPLALALFALALTSAAGQTPATRQIVRPIDESALTTIKGSTHPLAQARYDRGPVPDSTPAKRLLLVLNRPPASEAALRQRIADLHDSASPSFHHWLTPAVVGANYGPADEDVATVSTWLGGHGFSIDRVHPGKTVIEFSGNTGQIRSAFHTEIHRYTVNGEDHLANNANLQIPDALTTAIAGIASLNDFHGQPNLVTRGTAVYTPSTHAVQPLWTYPINTAGNVYLALAPGDFNVQYDVPSSTYTGSGVTIGIIGASNVDVGLVNSYRSVFGLPANQTQVVVDGEDPGQNGAATESYLDVEAAGSVAPGATVVLYTSASSALTDGLFTAAIRAVNDDTADVLSMSYGECESVLGTSTDLFF